MKPNKRILPLIAAVVCMPISVYAHGLGKAGLINADWTPIQVGAWPFSVFSAETKVYGVNFDLLGAYQEDSVCGLTIAPINVFNMASSTDTYGVTIGLVSVMESHTGLLVSLASGKIRPADRTAEPQSQRPFPMAASRELCHAVSK